MKKKYVEEVAPALMTKFQYASVMQIPKIEKIVVSVGCGDCKDNAQALDAVLKEEEMYALVIDPADGFDTGTVESWLETNNVLYKRKNG